MKQQAPVGPDLSAAVGPFYSAEHKAAWAQLYSTTSYPFDAPAQGKIAVKVINHYGDEVLKVYDVAGKR
jgi:hypothetical protein